MTGDAGSRARGFTHVGVAAAFVARAVAFHRIDGVAFHILHASLWRLTLPRLRSSRLSIYVDVIY